MPKSGLCRPDEPQSENKREISTYTLLENKKKFEHGGEGDIVIGVLGTIPKGLLKGLEDLEMRGRIETIQTTVLLRSTRILRRVLETRRLAVYPTPVKGHPLTLV